MGDWRFLGASVRGPTHEKSGLPNQDALLCWPAGGRGLPLITCLADGHGSRKCFHSDIGARLAVEEGRLALLEYLEFKAANSLSEPGRSFGARLSGAWRERVRAHLASRGADFQAGLARLEAERGAAERALVAANPHSAFGCTFLGAGIDNERLVLFQLGDGDILLVDERGEVSRGFARETEPRGDETDSLSQARAEQNFLSKIIEARSRSLALVLLSTDGYANSFRDEAGFLRVAADFFTFLQDEDPAELERNLVAWCQETTTAGSGDDLTVALLYDDSFFRKVVTRHG